MIIPPKAESSTSSSMYRLKRGTRFSELPPQPPTPAVPTLSSLDGPFQLAEYLAFKVRDAPHDIKSLVEVPSGDGSLGGNGPERDVVSWIFRRRAWTIAEEEDSSQWIYEHLRRIPIDLTPLITSLLTVCSKDSCAQMKADEWLYLCVAHGSGGIEECCAIDYILHTLDATTALLNSSKNFPSRMSIPSASLTHFPSLFRRLSRIFSHAYYHHRESFSLAEAETSLYARFVGLCEHYNLIGPGLLVIPRDVVVSLGREEEDDDEDSESSSDDEQEGERGRVPTDTVGKRPHSLPPQGQEPLSTVQKVPLGRGTLSRGKNSRGTMLWSSESSAPSLPDDKADEPKLGRNRSESIQSAVHLGPEEVEILATPEHKDPEVPKDDIELLEEQGKIPPLKVEGETEAETGSTRETKEEVSKKDENEMEDVALDAEVSEKKEDKENMAEGEEEKEEEKKEDAREKEVAGKVKDTAEQPVEQVEEIADTVPTPAEESKETVEDVVEGTAAPDESQGKDEEQSRQVPEESEQEEGLAAGIVAGES
ncbi:hypothetical protein P7C73_g3471, partial [Tremellales sp. Uapishka_1]